MRSIHITLLCIAIALLAVALTTGFTYPMQVVFFLLTASCLAVMAKGVAEGSGERNGK